MVTHRLDSSVWKTYQQMPGLIGPHVMELCHITPSKQTNNPSPVSSATDISTRYLPNTIDVSKLNYQNMEIASEYTAECCNVPEDTHCVRIIARHTCERWGCALKFLGTVWARDIAPTLIHLDSSHSPVTDEVNILQHLKTRLIMKSNTQKKIET